MKLLFQTGNSLACLLHGVLNLLIDIISLAAFLHCAIADFFQLRDTLPDLLLILFLFGYLPGMVGLLLHLIQESPQTSGYVSAHLAHLCGIVDALFHLGEAFFEFLHLHMKSFLMRYKEKVLALGHSDSSCIEVKRFFPQCCGITVPRTVICTSQM
jgi:hypothetical protein